MKDGNVKNYDANNYHIKEGWISIEIGGNYCREKKIIPATSVVDITVTSW